MTDESLRDLDIVMGRAAAAGVKGRAGLTTSLAVRWALSLVASGATAEASGKSVDAKRVCFALSTSGMTSYQLAAQAGCSPGHVRAVAAGRVPLRPDGDLGAWLAAWEASR